MEKEKKSMSKKSERSMKSKGSSLKGKLPKHKLDVKNDEGLNSNIHLVSKFVFNKNDKNLSLERKMKISQNYPSQKIGLKLNPQKYQKKNPNLWDKQVNEINQILSNFEHVSLM